MSPARTKAVPTGPRDPAAWFRPWLLLTVALGVLGFFVADDRPAIGIAAIALAGLAGALTRSADLSLPRWLLNVFVLGVAALAGLAAFNEPERFVESFGALTAWVQVIKLYERPSARNQGQILILSVFTVVAACLTSNSLPVGAMLALYIPVATWTILLFQLRSAHAEAVENSADARVARAPISASRALRGVTIASIATVMPLAVILYLIIPRGLGGDLIGEWSSPAAGSTIGFTDEVVLGREGELESRDDPVLDLAIFDENGVNKGSAQRPVLLRGAALDEYDPVARVWRRSAESERLAFTQIVGPTSEYAIGTGRTRGPLTTQRITIRSNQGDHLFAMYRPVSIAMDRETQLVIGNVDYVLATGRRPGRIAYTVVSQTDFDPIPRADRRPMPPVFREGPVREYAERILEDQQFERDVDAHHTELDRRIAAAIERHLTREFRYTTTMTAPREGEDPIEMFLGRTREGHCEYFASAMAALCRSIGIDARVVSGFRASEFNEIAGVYTVRQSDAHSWVEVLTAPGLWETFDPSPADGVDAAAGRPGGIVGRLREIYGAIDHAWVTWVVGFDESARSSIFGVPEGNMHRLGGPFEAIASLSAPELRARVVRAFLVGVVVFAGMSVGLFILREVGRRLAARRGPGYRALSSAERALEPALRDQIAFYRRLLAGLARAGIAKPPWRPPLAHADALGDDEAARAVRTLGSLYYAARFGRRLLTAEERAVAEDALRVVEALPSRPLSVPLSTGSGAT